MMIEFVWLPSNSWIAGLLLRQTGYLFLSYNNIFAIITGSPFVSLALFILVIVNLLIAYYQIGLLFIGARHLLCHEKRTLLEYSRKVFRQSFLFMKQVTLAKITFIFFYVMMLFPVIRKILKIYYLNKIVIPDFIVDYGGRQVLASRYSGYYSSFTSILYFSAFHVCPTSAFI